MLGRRDHSASHRAMIKLGEADGAPLMCVNDPDGTLLWQAP